MSATTTTAVPTGTYTVDSGHSSVEFQVKHLGIATVKGFFSDFEGSLEIADDGTMTALGAVQAASLNTRNGQRDDHLRSADFFDVENHPQIGFRSTSIVPLDGSSYRIVGELTIRGTTNEIELRAVTQGLEQDPWGNTRVGLEVAGELNREEFGLTWNQALESGGVLVGKKVKLQLEVSAVQA